MDIHVAQSHTNIRPTVWLRENCRHQTRMGWLKLTLKSHMAKSTSIQLFSLRLAFLKAGSFHGHENLVV